MTTDFCPRYAGRIDVALSGTENGPSQQVSKVEEGSTGRELLQPVSPLCRGKLGPEPNQLMIENRKLGRACRQAGAGFREHPDDAAQHPRLAR